MDIWNFINSRTVREHLKRIDYQFSSLEAAWLIRQSRYTLLRDKHEAWERLIETMPDCAIEARENITPRSSLHAYLRQIMDIENKRLSDLMQSEGAIYIYDYFEPGLDGYNTDYTMAFSDYEKCLEEIRKNQDICFCAGTKYRIHKLDIGDETRSMSVWLSAELEIKMIARHLCADDEDEVLYGSFDEMWFDFPTP